MRRRRMSKRQSMCSFLAAVALLAVGISYGLVHHGQAGMQVAAGPDTPEAMAAGETSPEKYVLLKSDFSNLPGMAEIDKPVFDRYCLWQREQLNLPMALPQVEPHVGQKIAYLTFDDGPDGKNTPAVLDILKAEGIKATFYVVGTMCERNPEVLKRIVAEGHAVGNHSMDHDYGRLYMSKDSFIAELREADNVIYSIIGMRPVICRAPGGTVGVFTQEYDRALAESGYVEHDWNVSCQDATPQWQDASQLIGNVDSQTNGEMKDNMALVLMHSCGGKEETVKALPEIIRILRDKGYSFGVVTPYTPQPW